MERRNTIQRSLVLESVNRLKSHATADEVYEDVANRYPSISRATVYRNLDVLAKQCEIRRIEVPGSPDRFDHIASRHVHVKCDSCGRLYDVDMDYVSGLEKGIRDQRGFDFAGYDIIFHGTCPECKKKNDDTGGKE